MSESFLIRAMKREELQLAIDWAENEGWNPGLSDSECFYQADPSGFFIGLLNGEPIAVGAAVNYDKQFAFCGLYVVKPQYRGQGYGIQLTHERLKYAGDRLTGLDGVLAMTKKYERLGYVAAHKNTRYRLEKASSFPRSATVVDLSEVPFDQLEAFDRRYFSAARSNFLRCWISQTNSQAYACFENGQLLGYGVIRKCVQGYKIGPLFATTPLIAKDLFEALSSKACGETVFLDIPEPSRNALTLVKQYQMTPEFEVIRMYRNGFPTIDLEGIYGITTFELG